MDSPGTVGAPTRLLACLLCLTIAQDLLELDEASIRREMLLTDDALVQRLGVRTRWFRPPFGHQDPRVRAILDSMGYVSINWDIDSTGRFDSALHPVGQ